MSLRVPSPGPLRAGPHGSAAPGRDRSRPRRSGLLLGLAALLLAACTTPRPSVFATDPPGARVFVDGEDSGFVTPCAISLPDRSLQRIDLALPGYETATRFVSDEGTAYWILFREMTVGPQTWRFPLWINFFDGLMPRKVVATRRPSRIFVRLRRQADL